MSITKIHKDHEAKTMTITAEFDQPIERAWQLWADPRKLERWWGPPTYPATVVHHDLTPGGTVRYFMTGPEGDTPRGWWRVLAAEAPKRLEFEDGFAGDDGEPNPDMPTTITRVALDEREGGGTRMCLVTTFPSAEAMDQMIEMGMEEGITGAMAQMDAILTESVTSP